jgi:hypothetical protein
MSRERYGQNSLSCRGADFSPYRNGLKSVPLSVGILEIRQTFQPGFNKSKGRPISTAKRVVSGIAACSLLMRCGTNESIGGPASHVRYERCLANFPRAGSLQKYNDRPPILPSIRSPRPTGLASIDASAGGKNRKDQNGRQAVHNPLIATLWAKNPEPQAVPAVC